MAQPVREDTTQDVILRVSQAKGTIIVEEHRTGGIISYREISPLELYYAINGSYSSNDFLETGFLPDHCLHVAMSVSERCYMIWNPELRADVIYGDTEYQNFPIPGLCLTCVFWKTARWPTAPWALWPMKDRRKIHRCISTPFPTSIRMGKCVRETMCCRGIRKSRP